MNITAGKFKGQKIIAPDENITRPTLSKIRMSIFNTLQSMIKFDGASFLDMYAGSGIMALEAISRGFIYAVAVEKHPKVLSVIKDNYKKYMNSSEYNLKLINGDSLKVANKLEDKFDVIYIDPPYYSGIYEQSLKAIKNLVRGIVVLEHVNKVDFGEFKILKQKRYGDKTITFLNLSK